MTPSIQKPLGITLNEKERDDSLDPNENNNPFNLTLF